MTIEMLQDTIEATADYSETNLDTGGSMVTSGCSLDCTPETVDVTVTNNTYDIDSVGLTIAITSVDATEVLVTITADIADFINLDCYFTDNPSNPGVVSVVPPTDPGVVEFEKTTLVTGIVSFTVKNTTPTDTWYLVIKGINGILVISEAITIGV